jgi:hypothetical protein
LTLSTKCSTFFNFYMLTLLRLIFFYISIIQFKNSSVSLYLISFCGRLSMRFPKCQSKLIAIYFHSSEILNIKLEKWRFVNQKPDFIIIKSNYFCTRPQNRYFPVILGVRKVRFSGRGVFYFATETKLRTVIDCTFLNSSSKT